MREFLKTSRKLHRIFLSSVAAAWVSLVPVPDSFARGLPSERVDTLQTEGMEIAALAAEVSDLVHLVVTDWDRACEGVPVMSVADAQKTGSFQEANILAREVIAPFLEDKKYPTSGVLRSKIQNANHEDKLIIRMEMKAFTKAARRFIELRKLSPKSVCALRKT